MGLNPHENAAIVVTTQAHKIITLISENDPGQMEHGQDSHLGLDGLCIDEKLNSDKAIHWDESLALGRVLKPSGSVWNSIGHVQDQVMHIVAEEALFLLERHGYHIHCNGTVLKSLQPSTIESVFKISFTRYCIYRHLKSFGYIVLRPDQHYLNQAPIFDGIGRTEYCVFKPNSNFKKTNPAGLLGRFVEAKIDDNPIQVIAQVQKCNQKIFWTLCDTLYNIQFLQSEKGDTHAS